MTHLYRACLAVLTAILLTLTLGCAVGNANSPAAEDPTLVVSAAANLRFAFEELGRDFEEETGTRITFNFGSTAQLAQQIEQGAPVDVFAAADIASIDELERRGLILPDTKARYARGVIVLWTRDDSPHQFYDINDVLQPGVRRVAIANPEHAPYGKAAREALQAARIWGEVQPRLVQGENVNQTLQYARTGNVDVAIVALSLAVAVEGGRHAPVPQELHQPLDQALAVVQGTGREAEARAFADYVNSPAGREILARYGFVPPGEMAP